MRTVPGQGAADAVEEEVQKVMWCAEVPEGVEELLDVALQESVAGEKMWDSVVGVRSARPLSAPLCCGERECIRLRVCAACTSD
jgi:hypothetical protein